MHNYTGYYTSFLYFTYSCDGIDIGRQLSALTLSPDSSLQPSRFLTRTQSYVVVTAPSINAFNCHCLP